VRERSTAAILDESGAVSPGVARSSAHEVPFVCDRTRAPLRKLALLAVCSGAGPRGTPELCVRVCVRGVCVCVCVCVKLASEIVLCGVLDTCADAWVCCATVMPPRAWCRPSLSVRCLHVCSGGLDCALRGLLGPARSSGGPCAVRRCGWAHAGRCNARVQSPAKRAWRPRDRRLHATVHVRTRRAPDRRSHGGTRRCAAATAS